MKTYNSLRNLGALAALVLAIFAMGCSKGSSNTAITSASTCSAGYVYNSSYGCLTQSTCPAGYGMYNGTCVQATTTAGTCSAGYVYSSTYGCLTQSSCPTGYGMYNNTCVPATTTGATSCPAGYTYYGNSCVYTGGTTTGIGTTNSCQGSCQPGYVYTSHYGCLPQTSMYGSCASCYGQLNGMCYPYGW